MTTLLEKQADLDILAAVPLLTFSGHHTEAYDTLVSQFREQVLATLARMKEQAGPDSLEVLVFEQKVACLDAAQLDAFYLQPEVLNRVLNYQRCDYPLARIFTNLNRFLDAEIARYAHRYDTGQHAFLWSAGGDFFIKHDAATDTFREFNAIRLSTGVPLDFLSVNLLALSKADLGAAPGDTIVPYGFDQIERIAAVLQQAVTPLHAFPNAPFDVLSRFASVILVKHMPGSEYFVSGTHGSYINRVVLTNPDVVNPSQLIDGLVHECIHGLLFMLNELEQWLPTVEEAEGYGDQFVSYWSGRGLPLRSFLEAHFVWFGLFRFWEFARQHGLYDADYAQQRMALIKAGFAKADIRAVNERLSTKLTPKLLAAIEQMQALLHVA